jgi:hypothetical protein
VTTRNEELGKLNCAHEADENHSQEQPSPSIAEAERDAEQKVDSEVLQIVAERGNRPVGGWT